MGKPAQVRRPSRKVGGDFCFVLLSSDLISSNAAPWQQEFSCSRSCSLHKKIHPTQVSPFSFSAIPKPVGLYPLNSLYAGKDASGNNENGVLSNVELSTGPNGKQGFRINTMPDCHTGRQTLRETDGRTNRQTDR